MTGLWSGNGINRVQRQVLVLHKQVARKEEIENRRRINKL